MLFQISSFRKNNNDVKYKDLYKVALEPMKLTTFYFFYGIVKLQEHDPQWGGGNYSGVHLPWQENLTLYIYKGLIFKFTILSGNLYLV